MIRTRLVAPMALLVTLICAASAHAQLGPVGSTVNQVANTATSTPATAAGVVCPPAQAIAPSEQTSFACALAQFRYTWVTVFDLGGPGPGVRTERTALINVPTPLDVDNNGTFDLIGTLRAIDASQVGLQIQRLPGVPLTLPVSVEAVIPDPGQPNRAFAVGYDGRAAGVPLHFEAAATLPPPGGPPRTTVSVNTLQAPPRLTLTAAAFTPSGFDFRIDPMALRAELSPVPEHTGVTLAFGDEKRVHVTNNIPTRLALSGELTQGSHSKLVDVTVENLPGSLALSYADPAPDRKHLIYDASGVVQDVGVRYREVEGSTVARSVHVDLDQLPEHVEVHQTGARAARAVASAPIGGVEVRFAEGPDAPTLPEPAYVRLADSPRSIAFRIPGLQSATIDASDGLAVAATRSGRVPFHAVVDQGSRHLDARVLDLPDALDLQIVPSQGRVFYRGDSIGELRFEGSDPNGLLARATRMSATVRGIPEVVDVKFDPRSGFTATTSVPVQFMEATATSGPVPSLDERFDGMIFQDLDDRFVVLARVHGLKRIDLVKDPPLYLHVENSDRRMFTALVRARQANRPPLNISGTINRLPGSVTLRLDKRADGHTIVDYDASDVIDELLFDGTELPLERSRADEIHARVLGVPRAIEADLLPDGGGVIVRAPRGDVGTLNLELTNGPRMTPPGGLNNDGVILRDDIVDYVVSARVHGLREARLFPKPLPDLMVDSTAGREFQGDLVIFTPGQGRAAYRPSIGALQRNTRFRMIAQQPSHLQIRYTADADAPWLHFEADLPTAGRSTVRANVSPLHRDAGLCIGVGGPACARSGETAVDVGVWADPGGRSNVDLLYCMTTPCDPTREQGNYLWVPQASFSRFAFDTGAVPASNVHGTGEMRHVYADTDANGEMLFRKDGGPNIHLGLPQGFLANDVFVRLALLPFQFGVHDPRGQLVCPPGTLIDVAPLGIDESGVICTVFGA